MARDYVGVRLGEDLRAQIETLCQQSGMNLSEFIRLACHHAVSAGMGLNGAPALASEGYMQGRALAFEVVRLMVSEMPHTYEDAIARYPQLLMMHTMTSIE